MKRTRSENRSEGLPPQLAEILGALWPGIYLTARDSAFQLSASKGAYVLVIGLDRDIEFACRRVIHRIGPGWHVYAGSAYGPGGIRARLLRHFRRTKKPHWHVDHITGSARDLAALPIPEGSECGIVERLLHVPEIEPTLPGFGNSDCTTCVSHLLSYHRRPSDRVELASA